MRKGFGKGRRKEQAFCFFVCYVCIPWLYGCFIKISFPSIFATLANPMTAKLDQSGKPALTSCGGISSFKKNNEIPSSHFPPMPSEQTEKICARTGGQDGLPKAFFIHYQFLPEEQRTVVPEMTIKRGYK